MSSTRDKWLASIKRVVDGREVRMFLSRDDDGGLFWDRSKRSAVVYRGSKHAARSRLEPLIAQHIRPGDIGLVVPFGIKQVVGTKKVEQGSLSRLLSRKNRVLGLLIGGYLDACAVVGPKRRVLSSALEDRFGPRDQWDDETFSAASQFVIGLWDAALGEGRTSLTRSDYASVVAERLRTKDEERNERHERRKQELSSRESSWRNAVEVTSDVDELVALHALLSASPSSAAHRGKGHAVRPVPGMGLPIGEGV